ncbi:hypothetical protein PV08_06639 [Exophiala spinifera]|uniref:Uncharacterized protein n=1 Tax=Exophiala spinifera TaxID=91928 RepID=A0A0D2BRH6_9EURO|nr:uncharacterized protein PV08_06639 [Exophiala spinifera]KIW13859.1 hypothetical protein PV08_06639 [Exophiala spinifera]
MPLYDPAALQYLTPHRLSGDLWPYVLCICFIWCIALIVGLRRRKFRSLQAETSLLPTTSKDLDVGLDLAKKGSNVCDLYHFAPLGGMDPETSPLMTSGQLAAKADNDKAAGSTNEFKDESGSNNANAAQQEKPETQPEETPSRAEKSPASSPLAVDEEPPWRRQSFPRDQTHPGPLRQDSTHHEMEHVPDEFHAGIIWRRRTIVFEGKA